VLEGAIAKSHPHKAANCFRIGDMKGQIAIGVFMYLLDKRRPQDLFGGHASSAAFRTNPISGKVLVHQIDYGMILFEYTTDRFQLGCFGMIDHRGRQRPVFGSFRAFCVWLVFPFDSVLNELQLYLYYRKAQMSSTKCAFFI
jgi:hypothetical protein